MGKEGQKGAKRQRRGVKEVKVGSGVGVVGGFRWGGKGERGYEYEYEYGCGSRRVVRARERRG